MISVVFSTRKENTEYQNHIKKTIGVKDFEVIEIVNDGKYSLTEAYNKGLKQSTNDVVAFIHDDLILPNNWGKKMINHFNNSDYGILGVAGTTDMSENGQWWKDPTKMVGIVKHSHNGKTWESKYSASFGKEILETVVVDGLFFVVDKNKIKTNFSEDIKGFHFYEIDFTFNNHLNGVKVGVVFDVRLTHKSIGQTNEEWEKNRLNFVEKYKDSLPYSIKPDIRFENKEVKLNKKPKLGIIIPTKGNIGLLTNCVNSLWDNDTYDNMIVYIADTGSSEYEKNQIRELIDSYTQKTDKHRYTRLIEYNYYNFAKINNDVVKNHIDDDTELLLFCNNDIKLLNNGITQMVNVYNKNKNTVGTIGARLHFGDNTIQHAGMTLFLSENNKKYNVGLSHFGLRSYYNYHNQPKNVVGNTGAFLMVSKYLFNKIGKFSESYLECFEDVELNLECLSRNRKNIFVSDAVCYHYESQTRNKDEDKLLREGNDYRKIIPKIVSNKKTYEYFSNVNKTILEQLFKNAKTVN